MDVDFDSPWGRGVMVRKCGPHPDRRGVYCSQKDNESLSTSFSDFQSGHISQATLINTRGRYLTITDAPCNPYLYMSYVLDRYGRPLSEGFMLGYIHVTVPWRKAKSKQTHWKTSSFKRTPSQAVCPVRSLYAPGFRNLVVFPVPRSFIT